MSGTLRQRLRMTWSARNVAIWGSVLVVPSIAAVFFLGKQPAHVEVEWALGVFAGMLFIFFSAGLYGGTRWEKGKADPVAPSHGLAKNVSEGVVDGSGDVVGVAAEAGAEGGLVGALIGVLVGILIVAILAGLGYLFAFVGIEALAVLAGGSAWVLYRSFRRVFLYSRRCEGKLVLSAGYALAFTAMYTGGGFALLHLLRAIV